MDPNQPDVGGSSTKVTPDEEEKDVLTDVTLEAVTKAVEECSIDENKENIPSNTLARRSLLENFDPLYIPECLKPEQVPLPEESNLDLFLKEVDKESSIPKQQITPQVTDYKCDQLLAIVMEETTEDTSKSIEKVEEVKKENQPSVAALEETIKTLKEQEAKLVRDLNARKNDEIKYRKVMEEYDKTIAKQVKEKYKLSDELKTVKQHLANLEMAFSDVHEKYERSKKIIYGYKSNEEVLKQALKNREESITKSEGKYESLKAHATAQLEKSNHELLTMRNEYESEIHKFTAIIRRLEIKNASLVESLDQKTKECEALAALCDEVTGKV